MKAIRGATTVSADTPEEIRGAVKELLEEIRTKNNLKAEDIIYIMFTSTSDITSFYPAKAAREAGFDACPLFSAPWETAWLSSPPAGLWMRHVNLL